ncbi:hypothetical protein FZC76_14260 [Sutcliffiella horikoshii]|uniref:Exosporium protein D n=1 Tax=Sutcliffiella horikoshii TaxID=79883 RepID=A0A5D4SWQ6_9BACI|nr:hypothetical protein [Sutcliffiella horikoshii]TYS67725.1 hypothetical protein FZC76_14260 [Sutcliffiella horikoshii]
MIRNYSFKSELTDLRGQSTSDSRTLPAKHFVETHTYQGFGENETGNIPITFLVTSDESILFEDFTENHNKTFFQIRTFSTGEIDGQVSLLVNVTTDDSEEPLEYTIPLSQARSFQFENVRRISVQLTTLPSSFQREISFYLQKTFCISCSEGEMNNEL